MLQTLVSTKYQIVIPKSVRRKMGIKSGQKLTLNIVQDRIVLSKSKNDPKNSWPDHYLETLANPWKDTDDYLAIERDSWDY